MSACSLLFFSGCGGSGSDKDGNAPSNLDNAYLQLIPYGDGVYDPGVILIKPTSGSIGSVNNGQEYPNSQYTYIKTGDDTSTVSFAMHTPDDTGTPTTRTFLFYAELRFEAGGRTGVIEKWEYQEQHAENGLIAAARGNDGVVKFFSYGDV